MAICKLCGKDMLTAKGCNEHCYVHGQKYIPAIKNGGPGDWSEGKPGRACHDCNAQPGEYHHYGCDAERCPVCKGQMLSCNCWGDKIQIVF